MDETKLEITLRDYFAAHAPAVPEWFKCTRQIRNSVHSMPKPKEEFGLMWDAGADDWSGPRLEEFKEAFREWCAAVDAFQNKRESALLTAWRYFYADAMIAAREQEGK